jgi:hypothetical protein
MMYGCLKRQLAPDDLMITEVATTMEIPCSIIINGDGVAREKGGE